MKAGTTLWYNSPAKAWTQSLPIGNGTLGGMIYGTTSKETISLNHDQLWTGRPKNTVREGAPESFKKARDLALEGKLHEAQEEIESNFQSVWSQAYMPLGDLEIDFGICGLIKNYRRYLDLENAVSGVEFKAKNKKSGTEYKLGATNENGKLSKEGLPYGDYLLTGGDTSMEVTLTTENNSLKQVAITNNSATASSVE